MKSLPAAPTPPQVPDEAMCLGCGYALRGLSSARCPECGRGFDPADLETMNVGRPVPDALRPLLEPVRWLRRTSTWACAMAVLATTSAPDNALVGPLVVLIAYAGVGLAYVPRQLARRGVVRTYRQPKSLLRVDNAVVRRMRWVFALAVIVTALRLPAGLAYALSHRALTRLAIHTYREIPATETPFAPRVCGVLVVRSIGTTATSVTFNLLLGGKVTYWFKDDGDPPAHEEHVRTNWWD
jgi:hypothetical protein